MPHAALCVSGREDWFEAYVLCMSFNAARSIVCVGTDTARHAVSDCCGFNAARSIVCVGTFPVAEKVDVVMEFQCRTQHCVCWDIYFGNGCEDDYCVSMPHAALCVSGLP